LIALIDWKIETIYQPFGFQKYSLAAPPVTAPGAGHDLNIPDLSVINHLHASTSEHGGGGGGGGGGDDEQMEIVQTENQNFQCFKIQSLENFTSEISSMLLHLSHHLSASPSLYSKLCRLFKIRLESLPNLSTFDPSASSSPAVDLNSCSSIETDENEIVNIYHLVSYVLLPSLSRIDCNPAISALCWAVISQFPFNSRFTMYAIWKGDGLGKQVSPPLYLLFCPLCWSRVQSSTPPPLPFPH
jgi:hypothetical protein